MSVENRQKLPWGLAWRISAGQIVSWGILYYAFTVVIGPMQAATGWSRPFLNSGLSLGLLTWGICAFPAGVWIQRRGGRGIMTLSSVAGGAALALMGAATNHAIYLAAWTLLGAAMAGVLYEPAFAVVTAHFGSHYRRGITLVTLVGGLASTAFIPLAQWAVQELDWSAALISLGAVQTMVCAPLYFLGIPRHQPRLVVANAGPPALTRIAEWWAELRRDISDPRFVGLAMWFTAHAAAFSGLIFQIVPILQEEQVPTATMLQAIALIGPMQVLGRLALAAWGDQFGTLRVGTWAMAVLAMSLLVLLLFSPTLMSLAVFAVLLWCEQWDHDHSPRHCDRRVVRARAVRRAERSAVTARGSREGGLSFCVGSALDSDGKLPIGFRWSLHLHDGWRIWIAPRQARRIESEGASIRSVHRNYCRCLN